MKFHRIPMEITNFSLVSAFLRRLSRRRDVEAAPPPSPYSVRRSDGGSHGGVDEGGGTDDPNGEANMGLGQNLWLSILVGWTSIYQLWFSPFNNVNPGFC